MPKIYYNKKIPADENTIALLFFDDPNDVAKDECGNIWEKENTTAADTTTKKFGASSWHTNCLNTPDNAKFVVNGDFTVDFWLKAAGNANSVYFGIQTDRAGTTKKQLSFWNSVSSLSHLTIYFWDASGTQKAASASNVISTSEFRHVAFVYFHDSGTIKVYVNGVLKITATGMQFTPGEYYFVIGAAFNNNGYGWKSNGYIDEFRISNCARWTENFTPPTAPYHVAEYIETKSIELSEVN